MRDAYFQPFAFFHNCVTIFEDQPNSVWVQETLAYLTKYLSLYTNLLCERLIFISTSELPSLARQSKLKRGRAMLSDSEGDTSENESAATLEQQRVEEDDDFDPPPVSFRCSFIYCTRTYYFITHSFSRPILQVLFIQVPTVAISLPKATSPSYHHHLGIQAQV